MKNKLLLVLILVLTFTLSGCFGNYLDGYRKYSKTIGTFDLYYQDLGDEDACPNETGHLYTLYSTEGNTFKYQGIRTTNGCYVELRVAAGSGLSTVANILQRDDITLSDIESVNWTFDFIIEQTPDYTVGTVNFIEYFEEIGDYEVFVIDYGSTICHSGGSVVLFEYNGVEYDVQGAPTGEGCISEYYIYYEEEVEETEDTEETTETDDTDASDDDTDVTTVGELMTVNAALQEGYISISEINSAKFESEIFETLQEPQILAETATIYFVNGAKVYNQFNPYTMSDDERNAIVSILAATKYQYVDDERESTSTYTTLRDNESKLHLFKIYDTKISESTESAIAVLTISDVLGTEYTYLLYNTGIQILNEETNAYSTYLNQNYVQDLLEELDE